MSTTRSHSTIRPSTTSGATHRRGTLSFDRRQQLQQEIKWSLSSPKASNSTGIRGGSCPPHWTDGNIPSPVRFTTSRHPQQSGKPPITPAILFAKRMNERILQDREDRAKKLIEEEEIQRAEIYAINAFMKKVFDYRLSQYANTRRQKEQIQEGEGRGEEEGKVQVAEGGGIAPTIPEGGGEGQSAVEEEEGYGVMQGGKEQDSNSDSDSNSGSGRLILGA